MTENRPCRFCAIAVTLATRTCVRLRTRLVGGLSSAAKMATVGRSLPLQYLWDFSGDKPNGADSPIGICIVSKDVSKSVLQKTFYESP